MNVPQLLGAMIAVFTPLLVVLTLSRAAGWSPTRRVATPPRALVATTIVAALLLTVLMLAGVATGALAGAISLGLFVLLSVVGWPAMGRIEAQALDALAEERPAVRSASLEPRRTGDVVPLAFRLAAPLLIAGAAPLLLVRLWFPPAGEQRVVIPLLHAGVAIVFYLLYGAWIRSEAESVLHLESGEGDEAWRNKRRSRVLRLWRIQLALVVIFLSLALILLSIDWSSATGRVIRSVTIVLGGLAGVVGCAMALSSGVTPSEVRRSARSGEARSR